MEIQEFENLDKLGVLSIMYARKWTNLEHLTMPKLLRNFSMTKFKRWKEMISYKFRCACFIEKSSLNETNFCDKAKMLGNNIGWGLYTMKIIIYMLCKRGFHVGHCIHLTLPIMIKVVQHIFRLVVKINT